MSRVFPSKDYYLSVSSTFTLLVNHEISKVKGVARRHGGKGAFVSEWKIDRQVARSRVELALCMWRCMLCVAIQCNCYLIADTEIQAQGAQGAQASPGQWNWWKHLFKLSIDLDTGDAFFIQAASDLPTALCPCRQQ